MGSAWVQAYLERAMKNRASKPKQEGAQAFKDGEPKVSNPYARAIWDHSCAVASREWLDGWTSAEGVHKARESLQAE